jgi:hypothetical protein
MHTRRVASFLVGGWILGSILVALLSLQSTGAMDRILSSPRPEARGTVKTLGEDNTRMLLAYESTEQNRIVSETWEWMELAIGVGLTVILLTATHVNRLVIILCAVMLILVVFLRFVLTPEIAYLGLEADFNTVGGAADSVSIMRGVYAALNGLKIALGLVVAGYLFVFKTKTSSRQKVNPVDHADHGRVDW